MAFAVGDKVRYSEYALRPKRDYWLSCGDRQRKSSARQAYNDALAVRGTVTAILPADSARGTCGGIEVTEDGGTIHASLPYLWDNQILEGGR